jgi:paraquat-inducible protein B
MSGDYTFWLTLAVVLGALALLAQAFCLYAIYRGIKQVQTSTLDLLPKVQATLAHTNQSLTDVRRDLAQVAAQVTQATAKAHAIMDTTQGTITRVDEFMSDATGRARVQMDRVESLVDDTIGRTRHTIALLNDTATRPVRELGALSAGLKAAFGAFLARRPKAEAREEDTVAQTASRPD